MPQLTKIYFQIDDPETWTNSFDEEKGWRGIRLLHMAGLYHVWQNEETIIYSYSVITMESNKTLDWLHHRMPAILDSEEQIEVLIFLLPLLTIVRYIFITLLNFRHGLTLIMLNQIWHFHI